MKVLNDMAQWGAIGLILWLLLGFDFDFLKESPQRISTLEAQVTEQRSKINSLQGEITDIKNKLQSVATVNDLKELQESYLNEITPQEIVSTDIHRESVADVESKFELLINYYSKNQVLVISCAVVLLVIFFLLMFLRKKIIVKPQEKAEVTPLKSVPKDKGESRECA